MIDHAVLPRQIRLVKKCDFQVSPSNLISLGILQNMEDLFTMKARTAPVRLFGNVIGHRFGSIALGALMSLTSVTGSLAAKAATLELSPMVATSKLLSTVDQEKQISVILSLPLSDSKGAAEFVQRVSNPKDPLYRQYVTPNEFAERYGGDAGEYATLKEWATTNGLAIIHESVARTFLTVRGTVAQFQTLFKTQLNNYRSADGKEFYSASVEPTIPDAIATKVTGVIGLTKAAVGDPFTGVAVYSKINGGWLQAGGTSVSAPLWASYLSILNAGLEYVTGQKLGFFNPTLYGIDSGNASGFLYPVFDGTNGNVNLYGTPGYNAGFGYNNCTGSGTIYGGGFGTQILSSETGGTPPGYSRIFDPTLTDTSAAFHWTKGKGATGYVISLFLPQHDFFECFVTKDTNITFKGLLPKSKYQFSVYGVNKGGATWDGFLFTTK